MAFEIGNGQPEPFKRACLVMRLTMRAKRWRPPGMPPPLAFRREGHRRGPTIQPGMAFPKQRAKEPFGWHSRTKAVGLRGAKDRPVPGATDLCAIGEEAKTFCSAKLYISTWLTKGDYSADRWLCLATKRATRWEESAAPIHLVIIRIWRFQHDICQTPNCSDLKMWGELWPPSLQGRCGNWNSQERGK